MAPALDARILLSTAASPDEAQRIARALVEERLAACVNIIPGARSIYRWAGEIHEDQELVLLIKTTREYLSTLEERLKALHSANVPEILVIVPESGSRDYLLWMDECLRLPDL
jgi:periplasmic divalent cation tolerance protein